MICVKISRDDAIEKLINRFRAELEREENRSLEIRLYTYKFSDKNVMYYIDRKTVEEIYDNDKKIYIRR